MINIKLSKAWNYISNSLNLLRSIDIFIIISQEQKDCLSFIEIYEWQLFYLKEIPLILRYEFSVSFISCIVRMNGVQKFHHEISRYIFQ